MTLPKPYFEDDAVTIYHGDCRELLPLMPKVDLVLTDPPYGIGWNPDNQRFTAKADAWWSVTDRSAATQMPPIQGDTEPFDPTFLLGRDMILWGANHYSSRLPDSGGWLVWDKRAGLEEMGDKWPMSEAELAWTNIRNRVSIFRMRWSGMIRPPSEKVRHHPNQKPVDLMRWCIGFFPDAQIILDPFMGSGTTLRAAKDLGRKAIGIEIEERYCEIAAKRMAQGVLL